MTRYVPLLAALLIVLGTGFVHGVWTQRWQKATASDDAAARLAALPAQVGDWQSEVIDMDAKEMGIAGADGWYVRRFTHRGTGQTIQVMLLAGRTGHMCVHRPEHCYSAAGFELTASPSTYTLRSTSKEKLGEFLTGRFVKEDPTASPQLRIFWSWFAGGEWSAPRSPRWTFAGLPVLYKLYVARDATHFRPDRLDDDPAVDFMRQLVPVLTAELKK